MSSLKKILVVALATIFVVSLGACSAVPTSLQKEWSYKTKIEEYPAGVYIYALYSAYEQAYSILSESQGDDFDSTKSILDISSTFDETDTVYICKDWVKHEADMIVRNIAALDLEIEKYGIELDPEIVTSARNQAKDDWYLGYYYDYSPEYSVPVKDILEPYGVSFESYFMASTNLASVKQMAIFNYFYNKGGTKVVPEADVEAYFEKEYTSYSYFTVNLYTSTQDENGVTSVPLSETELNTLKGVLKSYNNLIEEGASFESVVKVYMEYAKLQSDPTVSNTEVLSSSSLPEDIINALEKMEEGTSGVVYTGSEDTEVAYFVYKYPIAEKTDEYLKVDTNYTQILSKLKGEEFTEYLMDITEKVECQVNTSYIDKCDPKMFEDNLA